MTTTPSTPQELLDLQQSKNGLTDEQVEQLAHIVQDMKPLQAAKLCRLLAQRLVQFHESVISETQETLEDEGSSEVDETDRLVIQTMDMKSWRVVNSELNALSYFC